MENGIVVTMKQLICKIGISLSVMVILPVYIKAQQSKALIEVAAFGNNQPIGVAVAPQSNRLFVSFPHRMPFLYGLTEIVKGRRVPFPDEEWNEFTPQTDSTHFVSVQDLYADDRNCLWVLDSSPGGGGKFKLLKIDLKTNKVIRIYRFEDLPKNKSALNDVCVDNAKQLAYLSDPGLRAIIVLNLKTGKGRVVLQNDRSVVAAPGFKLHLDGKDVEDDQGRPFVSNINGVALTKDNRYFYFRAINQTKLYRIQTQYLADVNLSNDELSAKIELVAETGVCHGMVADRYGNIYLSNSASHAIQYVTPKGEVKVLVQDERLSWPDSFGIGNDGYLYVSSSQMNRQPRYNHGKDLVDYPYRVYKVKLPGSFN